MKSNLNKILALVLALVLPFFATFTVVYNLQVVPHLFDHHGEESDAHDHNSTGDHQHSEEFNAFDDSENHLPQSSEKNTSQHTHAVINVAQLVVTTIANGCVAIDPVVIQVIPLFYRTNFIAGTPFLESVYRPPRV